MAPSVRWRSGPSAVSRPPRRDAHGNTTTLGAQTLGYDSTDRHLSTTTTGGTTITYQRDATDRIVSRVDTEPGSQSAIVNRGGATSISTTTASSTVTVNVPSTKVAGDVWSSPAFPDGSGVAGCDHAAVSLGRRLS